MAFVSTTHGVALETQSAFVASIILAVFCTIIEACFAHTFSETIGSGTATQMMVVVDGNWDKTSDPEMCGTEGRQCTRGSSMHVNAPGWGGGKTVSKAVHNTAYTVMQAVHGQSHESTTSKQNSSRRLDTANFLQALQSHK